MRYTVLGLCLDRLVKGLLLVLLPLAGVAQNPVTRTYALQNVRIIQSPDHIIPVGTIIIKDGLIAAVGKDIPVPSDALIMDSDSMYVYPGFIDGFSHAGVLRSEVNGSERMEDRGNPPPALAGITPQEKLRNHFNSLEKSVDQLRSLGFGVAHIVPYGNFLPGQSAVVLLGNGSFDNIKLHEDYALYSDIRGTRGIYPSTFMGVMAKWRELYQQAENAKAYLKIYEQGHSGLERPYVNQILEAFFPLIDRSQSVIFNGEKVMDIQRSLMLKDDLGLSVSLGDVKEGWLVMDKIKSSGADVFLSLAIPDGNQRLEAEVALLESERKSLEARDKESLRKYVGQAAAFEEAGISFGFSTLSAMPSRIRHDLIRMVSEGLTESTALKALTTVPANILGVSDQIGSVEKGKIANLIVTDGSYFDEKTSVYTVFVDGVPYIYKEKEKNRPKKPVSPVLASLDGAWAMVMKTDDYVFKGKLSIKQENGLFTGTFTTGKSKVPTDLKDMVIEGNTMTFSFIMETGMAFTEMLASVSLSDKSFEGKAKGELFQDMILEGRKIED